MRAAVPLLALAAAMFAAACDFPADPPLRSSNPPGQDTTRYLLPLKTGNQWSYRAHPRARPFEPLRTTVCAPITWNDTTFHEVEYYYVDDNGPGPPRALLAFPSLLLNDKNGLHFFLKRIGGDSLTLTSAPTFLFTFPYPAKAGDAWSGGTGYNVRLVSTDSLVYDTFSGVQVSVYRYDLTTQGGGNDTATFLIIPGAAILRIEERAADFETVSWRLQ